MLINVKMPSIVDILTFIIMINTTSDLKALDLVPVKGRRFGTTKMHLSHPVAKAAVHSKVAVVLLLMIFCLLLLPLWESVIVLCFVVRYLCPL